MGNSFEMIGKLTIGKESEKFKPYEKTSYDSGWAKNKLLFNVLAGENRHMLESSGLYKEDGTGVIYSFTKGTVNETTHEKTKGVQIQIPWKDRTKPEIIDKIAGFKKYIIDLEVYGRRYDLERALEKHKEGTLSEEELSELGVTNIEEAVVESNKKKKVFLSEVDFTEYLYKLISSGKVEDKLFRIKGDIVYNENKGVFYKKLIPTRIYLAEKDVVAESTGQILIYFNKDSLDSASFKDTKKHYVNGFIRNYDNNRKEIIPCPIQLVIDGSKDDEKVNKFVSLVEKQFTVKDNTWKEIGVKVKLLDGAQKAEITDDMLSDFQKEMLELDAITLDDIRKEIGGEIYGDKVQEMVIINVIKGYTKGRKDTVYINSDFVIKEKVNPATQEKPSTNDEDELFEDFDDIDI